MRSWLVVAYALVALGVWWSIAWWGVREDNRRRWRRALPRIVLSTQEVAASFARFSLSLTEAQERLTAMMEAEVAAARRYGAALRAAFPKEAE